MVVIPSQIRKEMIILNFKIYISLQGIRRIKSLIRINGFMNSKWHQMKRRSQHSAKSHSFKNKILKLALFALICMTAVYQATNSLIRIIM
jgi:hypothetical protein